MTASEALSLRYYEICAALLHRWNFALKNDKNDMNEACRRCGASYEELRSILKYLRAQYLNNYLMATKRGEFTGDLYSFYTATKRRPGGNRRSGLMHSTSSGSLQAQALAAPPRYPTGAGDLMSTLPPGWYGQLPPAYPSNPAYMPSQPAGYAHFAVQRRPRMSDPTVDIRLLRQVSDPTPYNPDLSTSGEGSIRRFVSAEESRLPLKKRHRFRTASREEEETNAPGTESRRRSKSQRLGRERRVPSWLMDSDEESELFTSTAASSVNNSDAEVDLNEDDEAAASVLLDFAKTSKPSKPTVSASVTHPTTISTSTMNTPTNTGINITAGNNSSDMHNAINNTSNKPMPTVSTTLGSTNMTNPATNSAPIPPLVTSTPPQKPAVPPSIAVSTPPQKPVAYSSPPVPGTATMPTACKPPLPYSSSPLTKSPYLPIQQMDRSMQTLALNTPPRPNPTTHTTYPHPGPHGLSKSISFSSSPSYLHNHMPPNLLATAAAASAQSAFNVHPMALNRHALLSGSTGLPSLSRSISSNATAASASPSRTALSLASLSSLASEAL